MLIIGVLFIRESPRWLFLRGRRERGIETLAWLRNLSPDHIYMVEEVSMIEESLEQQRAKIGLGFWKPFKAAWSNNRILYRLFLGSMLFLWQNGSGINAINYYSPTVFHSIGVTGGNTSLLTTGIFGVVKAVITFVWLLYLIDHMGRRLLLLVGAGGGSICLWIVGGYIKIAKPEENPPGTELDSGGIAAIFFFYLWTAFYTPSWNGTPWVVNSVCHHPPNLFNYKERPQLTMQEMFDPTVRSLAQACAAASNWLWNFLISRFTPQMFTSMGYGVYFFFASLMILSIVFVFFLIPETKGVPLESMERLFEVKPVWKAHGEVLAELKEREHAFRADVQDGGKKGVEEFVEEA